MVFFLAIQLQLAESGAFVSVLYFLLYIQWLERILFYFREGNLIGTIWLTSVSIYFRVAGNAAYILGTLAESESGCMRVLCLAKAGSPESRKILQDLTRMLTFDDSESVMNAAGTMGTLVSNSQSNMSLV